MQELYIHIGLPKRGTSFLQTHIFPVWQGLTYIRRPDLDQLAAARGDSQSLYLDNLRAMFPQARLLVYFRRHASYSLSLYKQYVHLGGPAVFDAFFDLANGHSIVQARDLDYRAMLDRIEARFETRPFVFFQEDLCDDLEGALASMGDFFGAPPPPVAALRDIRQNAGVGHYQARLLRLANKISASDLNPGGLLPLTNRYTVVLRIDPQRICQEWLAFLARRPLALPKATRRSIDEHFRADRDYVRSYARAGNG